MPKHPTRYHTLVDLFALQDTEAPQPISHPDPIVDRLAKNPGQDLREAAVLLPITRHRPDRPSEIVLTVRSANLKSHAGQISLPGGTREPEDANAEATALRETTEEIGLDSELVQVIGRLGDLALPSGFHVTPVVGLIDAGLDFIAEPAEVADIFSAPLELVLDTAAYRSSYMTFENKPRKIIELVYEDYRIWGATAAILFHLAQIVDAHDKS